MKQAKEQYEKLLIEIKILENEDILTVSSSDVMTPDKEYGDGGWLE